jgi:cytochrome c oxidase cbb3-type subunit 1
MSDESSSSVRSPSLADIYASARLPLVVLFLSAGIWLLLSSVLGLIASLQFHKPSLFANVAWLTYGRVRPAATNCFLYGFCLQAGLGVSLWLISRLGRALVVQSLLITVGAKLWNLGVTVGIIGILAGDGSGYENFDMPRYAAPFLFLGFAVMAIFAILTFHRRTVQELYVSQWFLLAAMLWFPWVYSTAAILLLVSPVRGMAQAVIAWWYSNNLQVVCLGLIGLGTLFYFIPRLTRQNLRSRPLALISFWLLMLLGSWGGIPNSAPVPAWLPAISTAATVLMIIPVIAISLNIYATTRLIFPKPYFSEPSAPEEGVESAAILKFFSVGLLAFLVFSAFNAHTALKQAAQVTDFTWFIPAKTFLNTYGFVAMVVFGATYYVIPTLFPGEKLCPKLVRIHFFVAADGIIFTFLPLAVSGLVQGFQLRNLMPFGETVKWTLPFLRAATLGDLLLLAGHVVFVVNITGVVHRFYRARAARAYAAATARIVPT